MVWAVGLAALGVFLGLRSYRVFTQEELVAVVRCEASVDGIHPFVLELTPVVHGEAGSPQRFSMHGEQWTVEGDILKWEPWLNWFGVRGCHKLTRLSSRYLEAAREKGMARSVYELNGGTSPLWRWLYRWGPKFPWVEAVYGSAAYVFAQPGSRWGVYATLSGYLIRAHPRFVGTCGCHPHENEDLILASARMTF